MASNTRTLSSNQYYEVTLNVNQSSQNITANTSVVSWSLVVTKTYGSGFYAYDSNASTFSVTIDGNVVSSGQQAYNFTGSTPKSLTIASGTRVAYHNPDGAKTLSASASWKDNKNGMGSASPSVSFGLTTIARATTPTLSSSNANLGSVVTINLPRASSSFTHDIRYDFAGLTNQTSGIGTANGATTSTTFTPPASLASRITNKTSNKATITVTTKSGSTVIGSKSISITLNIPNNSTYNPVVGAPSISEQNSTVSSSFSGIWVQNHSKIRISASITLRYSATIKSARIYIGGSWHNASISGSTVTIGSNYTPTTSGSHNISVEIIDSRGRTASRDTSITVTAYSAPKLTAKANRHSTATIVQLTASVTGSSMSAKNLIQMEAYMKESTASGLGTKLTIPTSIPSSTTGATLNWGTLNFSSYSETKTYELTVRVRDRLSGWSQTTLPISTSRVVMDVYKDVGVSFGRLFDPGLGGSVQIEGSGSRGLTITGQAGDKPMRVRGIEGATATGSADDSLYLNWIGKNAVYTGGNLSVNGAWTRGYGIVSSGTNSNGEYVRFDNGIQICWKRYFQLDYVNNMSYIKTWAYPISFSSEPVVISTKRGDYISNGINEALAQIDTLSSSNVRVKVSASSGVFSTGQTIVVDAIAIGSWS